MQSDRCLILIMLFMMTVSIADAIGDDVQMMDDFNAFIKEERSTDSILFASESFDLDWEKLAIEASDQKSTKDIYIKLIDNQLNYGRSSKTDEIISIMCQQGEIKERGALIAENDRSSPVIWYEQESLAPFKKAEKQFILSNSQSIKRKRSPFAERDEDYKSIYDLNNILNYTDKKDRIEGSAANSGESLQRDEIKIIHSYDQFHYDQDHLNQLTAPFNTLVQITHQEEQCGDGSLFPHFNLTSDFNYMPGLEYNSLSNRREREVENLAVIIGINEYNDRMSLHNSVKDAESVADLLRTLGYSIILLTDRSGREPTKHNILDVALEELKLKNNKGNIIFYFSGHGNQDEDGTFYLIPKDSNGHKASFISEVEFKQRIKDLNNLALIIDACNSEGLSRSIGEGQLIIASSKKNEPSNEQWIGSMSVFTSNLINAIKVERRKDERILLQDCFQQAYNDTISWSKGFIKGQTPVITDRTGGRYYIN